MSAVNKLKLMMLAANFEAAMDGAENGQFDAAILTLNDAIALLHQMSAEARDFQEENPKPKQITLDV